MGVRSRLNAGRGEMHQPNDTIFSVPSVQIRSVDSRERIQAGRKIVFPPIGLIPELGGDELTI